MTDPTGTVGLPTGTAASSAGDLELVLKGGPHFMARLRSIAAATDQHAQAFARLRVGQDVEAALKDAVAQREAARNDRALAATELAKARQDAAAILADATRSREAAATALADARRVAAGAQAKERQVIEAGKAARQEAAAAQLAAALVERTFTDKIDRLKGALAEIR